MLPSTQRGLSAIVEMHFTRYVDTPLLMTSSTVCSQPSPERSAQNFHRKAALRMSALLPPIFEIEDKRAKASKVAQDGGFRTITGAFDFLEVGYASRRGCWRIS